MRAFGPKLAPGFAEDMRRALAPIKGAMSLAKSIARDPVAMRDVRATASAALVQAFDSKGVAIGERWRTDRVKTSKLRDSVANAGAYLRVRPYTNGFGASWFTIRSRVKWAAYFDGSRFRFRKRDDGGRTLLPRQAPLYGWTAASPNQISTAIGRRFDKELGT